jgi:hypothetical protein
MMDFRGDAKQKARVQGFCIFQHYIVEEEKEFNGSLQIYYNLETPQMIPFPQSLFVLNQFGRI